jgi:hypothetical protein
VSEINQFASIRSTSLPRLDQPVCLDWDQPVCLDWDQPVCLDWDQPVCLDWDQPVFLDKNIFAVLWNTQTYLCAYFDYYQVSEINYIVYLDNFWLFYEALKLTYLLSLLPMYLGQIISTYIVLKPQNQTEEFSLHAFERVYTYQQMKM